MNKLIVLVLGICIIDIHASETTKYDPALTTAQNFKNMLVAQIQSAHVPRDWPEYDPALTPGQKFQESQRINSRWPQLTETGVLNKAEFCHFLSKLYAREAVQDGCPEAIVDMVSHLRINVVVFKSRPDLSSVDLDGITKHVNTHVNDPKTLKKCIENLNDVRWALFHQ